ncbi:MAG: hypothetical protein IKT79_06880 [Akkermansia sp.]|nr:hypothetical protein [Akkermansia sp.]
MNEVVITLSHPVRALHPNGRAHWAVKYRAAKNARHTAAVFMRCAMHELGLKRGVWVPQRYRVEWCYKGSRPDADNVLASCKAYLDGCADALGIDDRQLECAGIERVHDKRLAGLVMLVFS